MRAVPVDRGDGTRFTVTLHPGVGDPTAPVALVVPAMGMPAGYYAKFAAALAAAGVSAAVTEQRGHEAPAGPLPGRRHDFGYAEIAADIDRAVDVLDREFPGAPVVLLGHSMGGHAAVAYLADHAERVAAVVLVASGSVWWRLWPRPLWQLFRTQAALLTALVVGYFPGHRVGFAGREARGVMRDWARFARTGRLSTGRPPRDHGPALAQVRLPVLAVSLAGDVLSPRRTCAGLAELLPAATVRLAHLRAGPAEMTAGRGEAVRRAPAASSADHFRWARSPALVLGELLPWLALVVPRGVADPDVDRSPSA